MRRFVVAPDDPQADDVRALLATHLAFMNEHSPPEDVHALDLDGLLAPDISFFSIRDADTLVAFGALKQLDPTHAELKSIHTVEAVRGRGVGRVMVEHLLERARERGCGRVSLETGTMQAFAPSRALYAAFGFEPCPPFGQYVASPNSVCMTLELT